jgi:hypothetical protein
MAYNRSKSKTSRRVKRAKTNKRNSARKQIFRKSRRINRGGKTPQKRSREGYGDERPVKYIREDYVPGSMEDKLLSNKENNNNDPHNQAQIEHEKIKDAENDEKKIINMRNNKYREPLYPGNTEVVYVNQTPQLENTKRQYDFEDMMDAEDPNRPRFGGKKKRATRRK